MQQLGNSNFENYIGASEGFSEMAYQMTSHVLTLGYAVMLAGLLYFILTIKKVDKRFQMSNILSAVVMVSAFLLLYAQAGNWTSSFTFDIELGRYFLDPDGDLFNNGYRYLNWLIDVPMLLFQILFVVTLTKSKLSSIRNQFWFSGTMMIITGYIGQFYEVSDITWFLIWGAISTVFFFHILYLMKKVINEGKEGISTKGQKILSNIWILFLISWFLYPGAYLMPYLGGIDGFLYNESGVVGRQITYTIADVCSKVIYGVLLGNLAMTLSTKNKNEHKPA
ncbi:bacteriorhodopsin [Nonlabens marinus]|uniref:Sodium ion rhodopsin n=1 Tax=Nonlabens marinus S1-08 TaxID=1454201 RepID=W8VZ79_9FLAO|nr:bacteriorhodopsin [Nonlabens marinus]AHN13817.1 sodium ion rhodopsin [Nonlabens marinus S1-08]BAO54106.1 sodium pumping rhodopsin [Nonlabens marinus S1-08]